MSTDDNDGAAVRIPPPFIYLAGLFAGILLHAFVAPFPLHLPLAARIGGTAGAVALGVGLVLGASRLFDRTGQDPKPWKTTPEIITTGIYRRTRNPMYISMALLQAAFGFGLSNGWILVLIPPVLLGVYLTAIRHEEAYLESKFGDAYRNYKKTVRRWI